MSDQNQLEKIERAIDRPVANALTVNRSTGGTFSVAPQNMGELLEFAKLMSVSSFCVRPAFRGNPGACLGVALQAFRCGGDPFAWCNKAYITRNKAGEEQISYEAQLVHAVVNSSTVLQRRLRPVYEGTGTARRCRIVGWVKGETEPLEYESPPISQIAVKNSPLWTADPDQQLFYYSTRAWARRHVPEILLGIYAPEDFLGETIDLTPEPEPQRQDFTRPALNGRNEPIDERPEFAVIDNDGVEHTFRVAQHATGAISGVLDEAARQDVARLDAAWENNQGTVEQLVAEGYEEATALCELYDQHRKALTPAPGPVEEDGYPGSLVTPRRRPAAKAQGSPQASETPAPSTEPSKPEPAPSAAAAPAAAASEAPPPEHLSKDPDDVEQQKPQRKSLAIQLPLKGGKPDYRTWAVALFLPKVRQEQDGARLAYLLGDNEPNLEEARRVLTADDARELNATIEQAQRSATYA